RFLAMSALESITSIFIITVLLVQVTWLTQRLILAGGLFATVPPHDPSFTEFFMARLIYFVTPLLFFGKLVHGSLIVPAVLRVVKLGNKNLSVRSLFTTLKTKKNELISLLGNILTVILVTAISIIISFLLENYLKKIFNLNPMLATDIGFIPQILYMLLCGWFLKTNAKGIFYEASVVTENLKGKEATLRSDFLVKEYKKSKTTIYFALFIIFVDLLLLSISLIWAGNKVLANKPSNTDFFMVLIVGVVGVYAITLLAAIIFPLLTISHALFYLKARQATGETLDEIFEKYQKSIGE
ncbi:MAG: hypothetical protein FD167_2203, partial [bacterium]